MTANQLRSRVTHLSILALVWVLASGCASSLEHAPFTANTTASSTPFTRVPIGLCEDYPEESRSLAAARRDLQLLATNNIRVLRIAFGWDAMEPRANHYDWAFWDEFVRMATDEYRIRLIPYICYTPRWASSSEEDDFWQHPPRDNEHFARFVGTIVSRYKDRIHSWEIWNEPDNPAYWAGSVEQFAALLAAGARAVRQADPDATVVFGGLAWDLNFMESVLTNRAAMKDVDVINLHNYYETWSSDPLEYLTDYVGRAHDILRHHNFDLPIWMAEVGYSSHRKGAHVSGQYRAFFRQEHTPEFQAAALFRVITLLLASEKVSLIAWYRVNDLPSSQEVIGDVNNRHLGVLDEQGRPKPSLKALRFSESIFARGFRCIDDSVRVTRILGAPVQAHAFELPDRSIVIAAWLQAYVPGTRSGDLSGTRSDSRKATLDLQLPFATARRADVFNELGEARGSMAVQSKRSSAILRDVELTGGSVTVLRIPAP